MDLLHHLVEELGDPDGLFPDEIRVAGIGEQEQVIHEALHPVHFFEQHVPRGDDICGVVDGHQFQVPAENGEGGPQLVAGVVQELLLVLGALIESFQHGVEGLREESHVVLAVAHFHAPGEVLMADHTGGFAQTAERIQQAAGHQASDQRRGEQRAGCHQ